MTYFCPRDSAHGEPDWPLCAAQHHLACKLLLAGHESVETWPVSLLSMYLDDALNRRMWVDAQPSQVLPA